MIAAPRATDASMRGWRSKQSQEIALMATRRAGGYRWPVASTMIVMVANTATTPAVSSIACSPPAAISSRAAVAIFSGHSGSSAAQRATFFIQLAYGKLRGAATVQASRNNACPSCQKAQATPAAYSLATSSRSSRRKLRCFGNVDEKFNTSDKSMNITVLKATKSRNPHGFVDNSLMGPSRSHNDPASGTLKPRALRTSHFMPALHTTWVHEKLASVASALGFRNSEAFEKCASSLPLDGGRSGTGFPSTALNAVMPTESATTHMISVRVERASAWLGLGGPTPSVTFTSSNACWYHSVDNFVCKFASACTIGAKAPSSDSLLYVWLRFWQTEKKLAPFRRQAPRNSRQAAQRPRAAKASLTMARRTDAPSKSPGPHNASSVRRACSSMRARASTTPSWTAMAPMTSVWGGADKRERTTKSRPSEPSEGPRA
mmetsp:Transcript_44188/g.127642  ORF Transcript_44188/g.127642 Transcript_44188/m.127642 type:complete len:433 (+) Transcript_44188:314-1612(+)